MKTLYQYLCESAENTAKYSAIRAQVRAGITSFEKSSLPLIDDLKKRVGAHEQLLYCQDKSSGHAADIFKGAYGEDDERAESVLARILDLGLNVAKKTYTGYSIGEYRVWSRSAGSSSLYKGWEVTFTLADGSTATGYVVNTLAPQRKSRTQSKLFTPNKLLDLSDGKTYGSSHEVISELVSKLESITDIDEGAASTLKKLVEVFDRPFKITDRTGSFKSDSFDDYLGNESGTLTIQVPDDTFSDVTDEMKNIIANDFGEVLDGLMFLKMYDDHRVSFPTSATAAAIDLNVISPGTPPVTIGISAKANNGAAASGAQLVAFYNQLKSNQKINAPVDPNTANFADAAEEYSDALTQEQRQLLEDICENVWNKTTAYGQCWIVDTYFPEFPEDAMREIFGRRNLCGADDKKQKKDVIGSIIDALGDPAKHASLHALYKHSWDASSYRPTNANSLELSDVDKTVSKLESLVTANPDELWGLLIYPAYAYSVNKTLNSKTNVDILTAVCNKFLSYRQVYIELGRERITWRSKSASTAQWKFECGNATTKPFVKKLCIRMIK